MKRMKSLTREGKEYLTVSEYAKSVNLSRNTVYKKVNTSLKDYSFKDKQGRLWIEADAPTVKSVNCERLLGDKVNTLEREISLLKEQVEREREVSAEKQQIIDSLLDAQKVQLIQIANYEKRLTMLESPVDVEVEADKKREDYDEKNEKPKNSEPNHDLKSALGGIFKRITKK